MTAETLHESAASAEEPVVIVVDDDDLMLAALRRVFASAKLKAELYNSGQDFLALARLDRPGCIILDVCMPGMDGLEVQRRLKQRGVETPVIFLTGAADVPIAVSAMREGAVDFIQKPVDTQHLVERVRHAIDVHRRQRQDEDERSDVLRRLSSLTAQECRVLDLLISGKTDREVARALGTGNRSVDVYRRRIMEKMLAPTLPDLVRMRLLAAEKALSN
jgi:FixJ family two-component response regulator